MSLRNWIKKFPLRQYVAGFSLDLFISVLRTGPVPQHIAFIMDGNRRFAKQNNLELGEGHVAGFESLSNVYKHSIISPKTLRTNYLTDSSSLLCCWRSHLHSVRVFYWKLQKTSTWNWRAVQHHPHQASCHFRGKVCFLADFFVFPS